MKKKEMERVMLINVSKELQEGGSPAIWKDLSDIERVLSPICGKQEEAVIRNVIVYKDGICVAAKKSLRDVAIRRIRYDFETNQIEKIIQDLEI